MTVTLIDLATGRSTLTTCKPSEVEAAKEKLFNGYFHIPKAPK